MLDLPSRRFIRNYNKMTTKYKENKNTLYTIEAKHLIPTYIDNTISPKEKKMIGTILLSNNYSILKCEDMNNERFVYLHS